MKYNEAVKLMQSDRFSITPRIRNEYLSISTNRKAGTTGQICQRVIDAVADFLASATSWAATRHGTGLRETSEAWMGWQRYVANM